MSQSDSHVDVTPQETTGRTVVGLFSHRSAAESARSAEAQISSRALAQPERPRCRQ